MPTELERFFAIPERDLNDIRQALKNVCNTCDILTKEYKENIILLDSLKSFATSLQEATAPEKYDTGVSISEDFIPAPGGPGPGAWGLDVTPIEDGVYLMRIDKALADLIEANSEGIERALKKTIDNIKNSNSEFEANNHEIKFAFYLGDLLHLTFYQATHLAKSMISSSFN